MHAVFLLMVSSAMWYRSDERATGESFSLHIGPLTLGWTEVYVSIITALTVYPPTIFVAELFRRRRVSVVRHYISDPDVQKFVNSNAERGPLPQWTLYLAWSLVIIAVVASAFFTFLYSLQWGGEKSRKWLGAFFLSLIETLVCLDPIIVSLVFQLEVSN